MSTARSSSESGGASVSGASQGLGAGERADQVDALLRPADQQHVVFRHHVLGPRVEAPVDPAADRHHPHPGLGGERQVAEGPARGQGVGSDLHAGRHLVGVAEVVAQDVGDPQSRSDHTGDVGRGVPDPLDRVGDPEHAGHALGVLGAPRGEHRHDPQAPQVVVHARFQAVDLARQLVLVEEDRRVREVHHELRRVLQFDEELFDVLRLLIH
jgi:hypothetical protein